MKTAAGWIFALLLVGATAHAAIQFDFGAGGTETGYTAAGTTVWSEGQGYGWISTTGLNLRDRSAADDLFSDFIFKNTSGDNVFRVSGLTPSGTYLLTVTCGDADYGDHVTAVSVPAGTLATLSPQTSEYLELSATVQADGAGILDVTFGSPSDNWVVNALTLDAVTNSVSPTVASRYVNEWDASVFASDPTVDLLNHFDPADALDFPSTGLSRDDYLTVIAAQVDFWKTHQNSSGAIIDPYASSEIQYSTPAFANAAAVLVVYAGRTDLLESAALAMDWASYRLSINAAAGGHDDFYPAMLANAYRLLSPRVDASRKADWEGWLGYDPWAIYDYTPGSFNWTVVASCGDALLQLLGIRPSSNSYAAVCWGAQGRHFTSPYGLYVEGPMGYDHFPRIWFANALAMGYDGPFSDEVSEAMDRAAITSLFMQSPWGELPAGGRSAHHQWNEATQCVTFEIYANKARNDGDLTLAAAYKRAAHLSLASMKRWVNSDGAMQVVKNWVEPSARHAYESYSYYSQYNLYPTAMLAIAYEHAAATEDIPEGPAPADTGGFMFQVESLNKVFANAGGTYIELDTSADHHYDATGLIRIHQKGVPPQISSDSLLADAAYTSPNDSPHTLGFGISWYADGAWRTLGTRGDDIDSVTVTPILQTATSVVFDVTYSGIGMPGVTNITEHYSVTPGGVELTTELEGYSGPLRYRWPMLSNDGRTVSTIGVSSNTVSVSQGGGAAATFTAAGADSVSVGEDEYSNHNGWARIGLAEYAAAGAVTLLISNREPDVDVRSVSPTGDIYDTAPVLEAVLEDNTVSVVANDALLLLDGTNVTGNAGYSIAKSGDITTVRYTASALAYGPHTASVLPAPGSPTNEWSFSVVPLPAVVIGDIAYVDAVDEVGGNTAQADGSTLSASDGTGAATWRERTYGVGGTNFEGVDNEAVIRTRISGLTPGLPYRVYVYFGEKTGSTVEKWNVSAGFSSSSLSLFANPSDGLSGAIGAVPATSLPHVSNPGFITETYVTYAGLVGTAVADAEGCIDVFIDSYGSGGVNYRTWYDGVGWQPLTAMTSTSVAATVSNGVLNVVWPESHTGWVLQSTTNLVDGSWEDVDGSDSGNAWTVSGSGSDDAEFFRIVYPLL